MEKMIWIALLKLFKIINEDEPMNFKIFAYIGAFLIFILCIYLIYHQGYKIGAADEQENSKSALANLANQFNTECSKDKQITNGIDNELQKNLSSVNSQLNSAKLLTKGTDTACYLPVTDTTSKADGNTKGQQPGKRNAVNSNTLIDFSGKCEKDRIKLIAAQKFIKEVWAAKAQ